MKSWMKEPLQSRVGYRKDSLTASMARGKVGRLRARPDHRRTAAKDKRRQPILRES